MSELEPSSKSVAFARTTLHATWIRRMRFLGVLQHAVPEALPDLYRMVVMEGLIVGFRELYLLSFDAIVDWFRSPLEAHDDNGLTVDPALATLAFKALCNGVDHQYDTDDGRTARAKRLISSALGEWKSKYNLDAPWVVDALLETAYWSFMQWLKDGTDCVPSQFQVPGSDMMDMHAIEVRGACVNLHWLHRDTFIWPHPANGGVVA